MAIYKNDGGTPTLVAGTDVASAPAPTLGDALVWDGTRWAPAALSGTYQQLLGKSGTTLTNDTVAALTTWEQWGTETITIANPGRAVTVLAWLTGGIIANANAPQGLVRVSTSIDGGTSWTVSSSPSAVLNSATISRIPTATLGRLAGTPTGDIKVKAEIFQSGGAAGNLNFNDGTMLAVAI